jgi:hypothetical protein
MIITNPPWDLRLEEDATDAWDKIGKYIIKNQQIITTNSNNNNESNRYLRKTRYPIWMLSGNSEKMNNTLFSNFNLKPSFFMNIKTAAINLQYLRYYIDS